MCPSSYDSTPSCKNQGSPPVVTGRIAQQTPIHSPDGKEKSAGPEVSGTISPPLGEEKQKMMCEPTLPEQKKISPLFSFLEKPSPQIPLPRIQFHKISRATCQVLQSLNLHDDQGKTLIS